MEKHRGLVGWFHHWAQGSIAKVVLLILSVMTHFEVSDVVLDQLLEQDSDKAKRIKTNEHTCDRLASGVAMLEDCKFLRAGWDILV